MSNDGSQHAFDGGCPFCSDPEPFKRQWEEGVWVFGGFCCMACEVYHTYQNISLENGFLIAAGTFDWKEYEATDFHPVSVSDYDIPF